MYADDNCREESNKELTVSIESLWNSPIDAYARDELWTYYCTSHTPKC